MISHHLLPSTPTGYDLYPCDDPWGIVVPIARRNLVANPSVETNTTGYTAVGGSIARTTAQQYHGAYGLAVTPGAGTADGVYYGTVGLTSGTTYAVSCKVRGAAGRAYKLWVATTGGAALATYSFVATGRWQWVWLFWAETSSTTRRIYLTKDGDTTTTPFYLDGLQVEACGNEGVFVTTYIDGDQPGLVPNQQPPAYFWEGTPHASISQRSGQTRAGGRVISFSRFGLLLTAIVGLGMVPPQHMAAPFAQLDGASYDRTRKPPRQFSLVGRFSGTSFRDLRTGIAEASAAFDRDRIGQQQPLVLRYAEQDSDAATIPALYAGGLEGNSNNHYAEDVSMQFVQYIPMILSEREDGAALTVQQSLAANNRIIRRAPDGAWTNLDTGITNGAVYAMTTGTDGRIYVGGTFTAPGTRVAAWNPINNAWETLSTGLDNTVRALAPAPNGDIYAGGAFTGKVARWNGSVWSTVGVVPGTTPIVYGLASAPNGDLYAVGIDTTPNVPWAARWNGSAWSLLVNTGSATGIIHTVTVASTSAIYFGGDFLSLNGVASLNRVARWDGSAVNAMATGMNNAVYSMDVGPSGIVYAAGFFTTAGGNAAVGVAQWNGVAWGNVGSGVSLATTIRADKRTSGLYVIDATTPYQYIGSAWPQLDVTLPGVPASFARLTIGNDTSLYIGYDTTGTAITGATTTIANTGTAKAYPTLILKGPTSGTSRIYQMVNATTNRAIFLNLTLSAGETATLQFDPVLLSFTSDFQGNIASTILPGSSEADFFLQPGENVISFFAADATVTATLRWRPSFVTLHDIARVAP